MVITGEYLFMVWLNFTKTGFEKRIKDKKLSTVELYRFLGMVQDFAEDLGHAEYDVSDLKNKVRLLTRSI